MNNENEVTSKSDFSTGSVWRHIVALAVPMTAAQLVQVLYNIVDRIYIGHLKGASSLALTGVGLTFPIITLIIACTNLFGMGGSPLCSIARGKRDEEQAEKIMGNTCGMLILSSVLLMAVGFMFMKPVLYLFGASDQTYLYAKSYLEIYLVGTPCVMIGTGMNGFINLQGFARTGMLTVMIGAVINIILDPIFIFVFDMGVAGAAVATVIAQAVSAVWVLRFLLGKQTLLLLKRKYLKPVWSLQKEILSLGLAGFIMSATNSLVQVVCNSSLQQYGGDLYVGIITVINSVREVIMLPVNGITSAAQPVLGFNYGAKEYRRVKKAIVFLSASLIFYTLMAWLFVLVAPKLLFGIFTEDPGLIKYGIPAMHIYFFGFFMMALQFSGQSTFVGLGQSRQAIFFSLFRKVIIVVPLTILLPHIASLGVNGVFLAEPISNFVGGTASFVTMLFTVRRICAETK
ncbi:MAG: MATE family efflux transporter [Lachnospiraceae bacterium]|nr:MATE family efflux transporter [Lachnospiraceae bacterium]